MDSFKDVIGYDYVKKELNQIIDMFKNRERYEAMGAKVPHGVMLFGMPGLGKTMVANAVIKECNVKSFVLKKTNAEKETLEEIKATFEEAKKCQPSIILVDDIDKFSNDKDGNSDDACFVAFQSAIDSVSNDNVLVVATANYIRKLPTSLLRAGRFDKKIGFRSPSKNEARKIIEYYLKDKCVSSNMNYDDISKMINYTSCAMLKSLLNDAAISAAFNNKSEIETEDIVKAYLKHNFQDESDEENSFSSEEIQAISYHEAGHALIAEIIKEGSVGLVSIASSNYGEYGGITELCEEVKRRVESALIGLGGKVAVELFYDGRCASGCSSDIEKVSNMIRSGVSSNATRGIDLVDISNGNLGVSNDYVTRNEAVTHAEIERLTFVAREILLKNKEFYLGLVEKLQEKKTLLYSDVQAIRKANKITTIQLN